MGSSASARKGFGMLTLVSLLFCVLNPTEKRPPCPGLYYSRDNYQLQPPPPDPADPAVPGFHKLLDLNSENDYAAHLME